MANNPYVNKVQFGNQTLIDLTSDTVTADKLMQGYTAHDRTGALITGTATGGGSVTQDQDGFIVLPPDGGGSPSGGSSYTLIASGEISANTTSTTATLLSATLTVGNSAYTSNKIIYAKIRNKSGKVKNYHYGNDCFITIPPRIIEANLDATASSNICYYMDESVLSNYAPLNYGVSVQAITSDGTMRFQGRYNSTYTKTINATYTVDVYLLDYADGLSPF